MFAPFNPHILHPPHRLRWHHFHLDPIPRARATAVAGAEPGLRGWAEERGEGTAQRAAAGVGLREVKWR